MPPLHAGTPRHTLIQALRALAAMAVSFEHTTHDALSPGFASPFLTAALAWLNWSAGVDVFFVVSGFVITMSSRRLFAAPRGAARFLTRRLARVVPSYWAATALFLLAAAVMPGAIHASLGGPAWMAASFLFIPHARPDGLVQPPLGLGWTLNHEMFFYAVFALFIRFRRAIAVVAVTVALSVLVALGQTIALPPVILSTWADPIVLEFCAGMLLALWGEQKTLPPWSRWVLAGLAIALLHFNPLDGAPRPLTLGVPAVLLTAAALSNSPRATAGRMTAALVYLGDASYALYLVHPFVMRMGGIAWRATGHMGGPILFVALSLIAAQCVALALHLWLERPATLWTRWRLERLAKLSAAG